MGCAISTDTYTKNPKHNAGYWFDREENLVTVNYTDSDSDFDTSSLVPSDLESSVVETLPSGLPRKAKMLLLDLDHRKDSGIDIDCDEVLQFTFDSDDEDQVHSELIIKSLLRASRHMTSTSAACAARDKDFQTDSGTPESDTAQLNQAHGTGNSPAGSERSQGSGTAGSRTAESTTEVGRR